MTETELGAGVGIGAVVGEHQKHFICNNEYKYNKSVSPNNNYWLDRYVGQLADSFIVASCVLLP